MSIFDDAIAGNARLTARWEATKEKVLADARAAGLGEINPDSLKTLPGVKLAIFTDMGLPSDLLEEVKRLPEVAATLHKQEVRRQLERGDSALHDELARMSPHQRMTYGRQIEAARRVEETTTKPPMDAEREAEILLMLRRLPPAMRMSAARAAGML